MLFQAFLGIEFCAFQETVESRITGSRFHAFHAFLFIRKSQQSVEHLFLALHAFPDLSGWYSMLSKKPWSPGKPGKLGIIPGFLRFFAHREKSGKRGIFIPRFPRFSRSTFSWLSKPSQAFGSNINFWLSRRQWNLGNPESAESLGFPRFPGLPEKRGKSLRAFLESQETSGLPGFSLCAKKAWKARNFSAEFRGFLSSSLQGTGFACLQHLSCLLGKLFFPAF